MQHRKPGRHVGRHRAPIAPRAGYAAVVTTAFVGAGVVALGVGSALPAQGDQLSANAGLLNAASMKDAAEGSAASSARTTSSDTRATRTFRRAGAPIPQRLPDWIIPARGTFSSMYAVRWGSFHYGLDIALPQGSTVRAAGAGRVVQAGWYGGYGKVVIIDHGNGVTTRYGHNSQVLVSEGEYVEAGEAIARSGNTGQSTGPHLHFEVRVNERPTNPLPFLRDRGVNV